eukprot:g33.t1
MRQSRDLADAAADEDGPSLKRRGSGRDTRRRSSTDGGLLGMEALGSVTLMPGVSNSLFLGGFLLFLLPYTLLLLLTLNTPKEQRSALAERTLAVVGLLLMLGMLLLIGRVALFQLRRPSAAERRR